MHRHAFLHQNAAHLPVRNRPFLETILIAEVGVIREETHLLYDRARAGEFELVVETVEYVSIRESVIEELFAPEAVLEAAPSLRERMDALPWELVGGRRTFLSMLVALPILATLLVWLTDLRAVPVIGAAIVAGFLVVGARRLDAAYALHLGKHLRTGTRFAFTTGMIFAVLFVGLNFNAYWDRVRFFVAGGSTSASSEKTQILEELLPSAVDAPVVAAEPTQPDIALSANLQSRSEELTFDDFAVAPPDDRLIIPKLGKNIPIIHTADSALLSQDWSNLEKQIQGDLRNGVVHYPGTAFPGEKGNVFITGHSSYYPWDPGKYKSVFAVLDQLVVGDQIIVYSRGEKYVYTAKKVEVVSPSRTDVLSQPTERSILTLMTCTPVGTAKNRLIIQFEQISPDPELNRTPSPNDGSRIQGLSA